MQEKFPRHYAAEAKAHSDNKQEQWNWIIKNAPEKFHALIVLHMRQMK